MSGRRGVGEVGWPAENTGLVEVELHRRAEAAQDGRDRGLSASHRPDQCAHRHTAHARAHRHVYSCPVARGDALRRGHRPTLDGTAPGDLGVLPAVELSRHKRVHEIKHREVCAPGAVGGRHTPLGRNRTLRRLSDAIMDGPLQRLTHLTRISLHLREHSLRTGAHTRSFARVCSSALG